MQDPLDEVADWLRKQFAGADNRIKPSAAPGAGPSARRSGPRQGQAQGKLARTPVQGADNAQVTGYGGHGDPSVTIDPATDTQTMLQELLNRTERSRAQDKLRERLRFNLPYSIEGHIQDGWRFVRGPFSVLDGTATAPSAGNSVQDFPVSYPAGTVSPIYLLDRYPGAMFMNLYIASLAWVPTGATGTGLQEIVFRDIGGAQVALGVYSAASQSNGFENIGALCNSPLTDPGTQQIGDLLVTNVGIGGTPTTVRWQLGVGYIAMVPDPWFQARQMRLPTPAEETVAVRGGY